MGKRLYVGNLSYSLKAPELEEVFKAVGEVVNVKVVMDQETGRSKGFAFVEMATDDQGTKAIETLNGKDIGGRALKVTEANPRPEKPTGGARPPGGSGGERGGFSRGGAVSRNGTGDRGGNRY
jgi:RNA recognition motif-containing protein